MSTPDPGYTPPEAPVNAPPESDRGSLLTGFLMGWVVLIGSTSLVAVLFSVLASVLVNRPDGYPALLALISLLPFASTIGLLVWFAAKGKSRSAMGVGLTFASLFALALLLVAACFGLLANSNFH